MPPRQSSRATSAPAHQPSYGAAALVGVAVLALYIVTLAPTTAFWDTSEYIAAAYGMGLPHPPGNPLFVLLGRVASLLPVARTVAERLNLLTAACSAVSAAIWFLVAERAMRGWIPEGWPRRLVAAAAALLGATTFTVWNQSVVNEKVYTIALAGMALVSWLALRWVDETDERRADRILVLIAYLLGLGYGNHMAGFLPGPAMTVLVLACRPRTLLRWRLVLACVAALVGGLTVFATQPIRSAFDPAINEGQPTACTSGDGPKLACTLSATTWERFTYNFDRKQYGKPSLLDRQASFGDQLGMWWLYFKWQWLRDAHDHHAALQLALALLFLGLGVAGGVAQWRHDRSGFWYVAPLVACTSIVLVYYMNFKLGYTQALVKGVTDPQLMEPRDRDYFFIWCFSLWGLWAALGLAAIWRRLATREMERVASRPWLRAAPIMALALVPLVANWSSASRAHDTVARDWAHDVLESVEPYGVLFTAGDNDSFPLWYAQEVEGVRRDVTVALWPYLGTDWYVRQLTGRPTFPFDSTRAPAFYHAGPRPASPVLALTPEEADQIPDYVQLSQPARFTRAGVNLDFPAGAVILRNDAVILQTIKDSFPERPVYFTNGAWGSLPIRPYLMQQGLVSKLMPGIPADTPATPALGDGSHLDLRRTAALWSKVYRAPAAIVRRGDWIDVASRGIALAYVDSGLKAAYGSRVLGDSTRAAAITARVEDVVRAAHLEGIVKSGE